MMGKGLLSIVPAGCGQLVKMLITLKPHGIFVSNLHVYLFQHCPAIGMQNGDEALPNIILAGRGILVEMLIILDLHNIF